SMPAPKPVSSVEPLPLEGASSQAMVNFLDASPSQIAATVPTLATTLDTKVHEENQAEVDDAPVLVAKTTGVGAEEGLGPAEQMPAPKTPVIGDAVTMPGAGNLVPAPNENVGEPPHTDVIDQTMEGANEGGLLGWLRENFGALLGRIRTTDPGVNTSAG